MLPLHLNGVVSPTLLVYKTSNIRVCDASILPFHLSCHPQATIYGIAEKGADLCKEARREAVRKAAIEVKANGGTQGGRGWLSSMIWGQDAQA